ncbi:thiamine phosphate synthase [Rhabdaerophilum calidifontis]|uniref:thiamine phosphate synthase n=1 Tax=Rhabdaerophilum calidifontis TaxID=2604328 RepID=UPI00123BDDFD|nr:thiamine phosphate synthase [Rhabdaerophilum calidifontis]
MVPQFFLITPPVADPQAFRPLLESVIATGALDVVLLRLAPQADPKRVIPPLRPLVQEAGIALLIEAPEDPRLVARLGIDGVHVAAPGPRLAEAVAALKPDRIVGIGGLKARHDAMEAGEMDVDYVMFGEPRGDGSVPPLAQVVERAEWWAAIFNTPCIAYAPDLESVAPLAATGAEFIALGPWLFETADPAETIARARRAAKARAAGPAPAP